MTLLLHLASVVIQWQTVESFLYFAQIVPYLLAWQARPINMLGLGTHNWHTSIRGAG